MVHLIKVSSLERLNLNSTGITDDGLREIHRLKQLMRIYFCDTKVTEEGLEFLKPLKTIEFVGLTYQNSPAASEALRVSLPLFKKNKSG